MRIEIRDPLPDDSECLVFRADECQLGAHERTHDAFDEHGLTGIGLDGQDERHRILKLVNR